MVLALLAILYSTQFTGKVSRNPGVASIEIQSEPTNSNVIIDGDLKGNTPKVLSLSPGEHDIMISRPGYELMLANCH